MKLIAVYFFLEYLYNIYVYVLIFGIIIERNAVRSTLISTPDSTSSDPSEIDSKPKRNVNILNSLLERRQDDSDSDTISRLIFQTENKDKAFDIISNKSTDRDPIDSYDLTTKESDTSTEVTTSTSDETLKDWSSEEGIKFKNKETILEKREEELMKNYDDDRDDDSNLNSENSDMMIEELNDKKRKLLRKSAVVKNGENVLTKELSLSSFDQNTLEINFNNDIILPDDWSFSSPERSKVIIKSGLDDSTLIDDLELFGSPRRYSLRSSLEQVIFLFDFNS
ncbi:hypothetical protein M0802_016980 [Mischocyttarus mexicanus]|nr:hypothetical protein M0802_016980 [Mischocyttarus mexicanus]